MLLLLIPLWLLRGRAYLKQQLAQHSFIDIAQLPYRPEMIALIHEKRASGAKIVLVTGSVQALAQRISHHLGCFDAVFGTEPACNLKGARKADFLRREFGHRGFQYAGDSKADLKVWKVAHSAYVVGGPKLQGLAARVTRVSGVLPELNAGFRTWISALRGHHWFKNVLLFLPVLLAHKLDAYSLAASATGFVLFGMCASGLYVLNDLLDLHADRQHPWKHKRPFAAGDVPIASGLFIAFVLLGASLTGALLVSLKFAAVLLIYATLTMWYSLRLKTIVVLDVFVLSSFYSIRIWAGAFISAVPLSQWFLSFSLFFFLSLAMAKRYSELLQAGELAEAGVSGRGYLPHDREVIMNVGITSSYSAVVIFCLYVSSHEVARLYQKPQALFLLAPILAYWLTRLWVKAHRGELNEDPITLALRDKGSYAVAILCALILGISLLGVGGL